MFRERFDRVSKRILNLQGYFIERKMLKTIYFSKYIAFQLYIFLLIYLRRGLQHFKPEKSGDRLSPAKILLTTNCIFPITAVYPIP